MNNAEITGMEKELTEKGIWGRQKIVAKSISAAGLYTIKCGFSPRLVQVKVQDVDQYSNGDTDFETSFSHRLFWTGTAFDTDESSNLISLSTLVGNFTERLYNGFTIDITTYSGGAKTVYFTCFS